jgi:hypothetical protein
MMGWMIKSAKPKARLRLAGRAALDYSAHHGVAGNPPAASRFPQLFRVGA